MSPGPPPLGCRLALFLGDERVQFIEFHRVYRRLAGSLGRDGRRRKASGGLVDPVDDGLVIDLKLPCDAPEVHAIYIQLEGLTPQGKVVAMLFRSRGVGAPAVLTFTAGAATEVGSRLMLLGSFFASRARKHKIRHTQV